MPQRWASRFIACPQPEAPYIQGERLARGDESCLGVHFGLRGGSSSAWPANLNFRCPRTADQPTMTDSIHPVPFIAHESQQNGRAMHISSQTMFRISRIYLAFMEGECSSTDLCDTCIYVQMAQLPDLPSPQSPNLDLIEDPFYPAELPSIMACLEPLPQSGMPVSLSNTPQPLFQVSKT